MVANNLVQIDCKASIGGTGPDPTNFWESNLKASKHKLSIEVMDLLL